MHAIDPSRCPNCGQPNACAMLATEGKPAGACWCANLDIPAAVLAAIPEAARRRACLCRACAAAGERAPSPREA